MRRLTAAQRAELEACTTMHAPARCPDCGAEHNALAPPSLDLGPKAKAGDLTVCIECGAFHVLNADLSVRSLSAKAFEALPRAQQGLLRRMRALVHAKKPN